MAAFFCDRCGRSAQSEQTLKRHERYCRNKTSSETLRRKSCAQCVKAKTKCIPIGSSCTRCNSKKFECQMVDVRINVKENNPAKRQRSSPRTSSVDDLQPVDSFKEPLHPAHTLENSGVGALDEFGSIPSFDVDIFNGATSLSLDNIWFDQGFETEQFSPYGLPEQQVPKLKWFDKKPLRDGKQLSSWIMATGIVHSYPERMTQRANFPPFIHPRAYGSEADGWRLPSPLANAMSIAQMFQTRTEENRPFIWRTIRSEQERMLRDLETMDKQLGLASFQALLIYCLMRTIDAPAEDERSDEELLKTANLVCHRLSDFVCGGIVNDVEMQGERLAWRAWIFAESFRRTLSVYRIAYSLFHMIVDLPCPSPPDYSIAPVPASKTLWRAETEEAWIVEWEDEVRETPIHGILNNGDLVKVKNGLDASKNRRADWAKWYAKADELGFLVVLAANL